MKLIDDNSRGKLIWDITIVSLTVISSLLISYQIGFDHNRNNINDLIIYLIDLFFILDIYFIFFTSYRYQGIEITDQKEIKRKVIQKIQLTSASTPTTKFST